MDKQYTEEDRCDTCQRITFEYLISIFTDTPNADQPETIFEYPDIETTRKTCSLCDTICLGRRRNRNTGPLLEIPCPAKLYLFPGYWNERGYEPSTDQFDCIWVVLYDNNTLGSSWNGMPSLSRCVSQLKLSVDDGECLMQVSHLPGANKPSKDHLHRDGFQTPRFLQSDHGRHSAR